jgi:hypothetical protein
LPTDHSEFCPFKERSELEALLIKEHLGKA